jgi:hypothetical protein
VEETGVRSRRREIRREREDELNQMKIYCIKGWEMRRMTGNKLMAGRRVERTELREGKEK